jgi:hypothetical protein
MDRACSDVDGKFEDVGEAAADESLVDYIKYPLHKPYVEMTRVKCEPRGLGRPVPRVAGSILSGFFPGPVRGYSDLY